MGRVLIHVLVGVSGGVLLWGATLLLGALITYLRTLPIGAELLALGIFVTAGAAFGWAASR